MLLRFAHHHPYTKYFKEPGVLSTLYANQDQQSDLRTRPKSIAQCPLELIRCLFTPPIPSSSYSSYLPNAPTPSSPTIRLNLLRDCAHVDTAHRPEMLPEGGDLLGIVGLTVTPFHSVGAREETRAPGDQRVLDYSEILGIVNRLRRHSRRHT